MKIRSIATRLKVLETREAKGRTYDIWYGIKTRKEVAAGFQRRRGTGKYVHMVLFGRSSGCRWCVIGGCEGVKVGEVLGR